MEGKKSVPMSLKIVAALFVLGGIGAVIEMVVVALMHSHQIVNVGILWLFIGAGLFRLRRGWRTCALVVTWLALIAMPLIMVLVLVMAHKPLDVKMFGQVVGQASKGWGVLIAGVIFLVALWQYRVLTRPDVKELFQ